MTFQLNLESMSDENGKLIFTYSVEGDLPLVGYRINGVSFAVGNFNFDVKYSITGEFIAETDSEYIQRLESIGFGMSHEIRDPVDCINDRVYRNISDEFKRIQRLLNSPQSSLDDLSN